MQPPSGPIPAYPQPGDVLDGKYRVDRLIGEGGMGAVAKATHLVRRAPVALKFISGAILSLPEAVERFVNEGVAASQIDSDHVVKVFDVGRLPNGAPYLVMEFLDGRDLGEVLSAEGPRLPAPRAVHFAVQMLRALQTAHNAGVVHRDVKPSNCLVIEKDGEPDFVKLVDFGISKFRASEDAARSPNLTRTNSALGTPLYMSPEQARSPRDVDHRSDLYSVGAILYEMLGGRTPYTSETGEYTEILFKIFTTEPEPLGALAPEVPEGLAAVVHRALLHDRERRHGSAAEMAEALAPFADARSEALFAKFRAARGRSLWPSERAPSTLEAPASAARAPEPAAPAQGARAGDPAGQAPSASTGIGLARDAAPRKRGARSAAVAGLIAAAAIVAIGAGAVLLVRGGSHEARATKPAPASFSGGPAAANAAAPEPQSSGGGAEPAAVELTPLPAAAPLEGSAELPGVAPAASEPRVLERPAQAPSAAPRTPGQAASHGNSKTLEPGAQAASAAPQAPALPKQLSDLKLH